MKILLVGASGTLGQAVARHLGQQHDILAAGRHSGSLRVDLTDDASVRELFAQTGPVDAVISTTGKLHFGPLQQMTPEQFNVGLQDKLLGQVRLALAAQHHLNAGGSITLTSGIVSAQPIRDGANATAVNHALVSCGRRRWNCCRAGCASTWSARTCWWNRWKPTAPTSPASKR